MHFLAERFNPSWNFDREGNLFGVRDYTDFPGQNRPRHRNHGMDIAVVLERLAIGLVVEEEPIRFLQATRLQQTNLGLGLQIISI